MITGNEQENQLLAEILAIIYHHGSINSLKENKRIEA
jgi:hypothetical protein